MGSADLRLALALAVCLLPVPAVAVPDPVRADEVAAAASLEEAVYLEKVRGDLVAAEAVYRSLLDRVAGGPVRAQALFRHGAVLLKLGRPKEAADVFARMRRDFPKEQGLAIRADTLLGLGSARPAAGEGGDRGAGGDARGTLGALEAAAAAASAAGAGGAALDLEVRVVLCDDVFLDSLPYAFEPAGGAAARGLRADAGDVAIAAAALAAPEARRLLERLGRGAAEGGDGPGSAIVYRTVPTALASGERQEVRVGATRALRLGGKPGEEGRLEAAFEGVLFELHGLAEGAPADAAGATEATVPDVALVATVVDLPPEVATVRGTSGPLPIVAPVFQRARARVRLTPERPTTLLAGLRNPFRRERPSRLEPEDPRRHLLVLVSLAAR